uniref:ABC transmembrane type-1 domain-containing protein n=1 Tax=Panagrolaimus davidi TaxID=227884 RepID=A0A914PU77_9BILA
MVIVKQKTFQVGAIVVALLNIRLPILLGDLVNVIAGLLTNKNELQFETINPIAGKLLGLYVAQAIFTFLYITSLSIMGERMAADLRVKLLNKLLHHDMCFFDEQRTGELNDRLNNDVQEFKSSFKLCVAQGLRTFAQTSGCIISLYFISPTMTMLTVGIVPMVILVGTFCGALLRKISLAAQAQSARASGVAEEALQNIRTVKAFAMEDAEIDLYAQEVDKARVMSEQLGAGIGLFQAGTNVFLNGIVLGKSTIVSLIERLYEPTSGNVTLDGKDLRTLDPYWLRRNVIGIISQEPVLFATTIEENIRYGKPDATDEEVREAAKLANAHEFIETFPDKYKTIVGERGVTLSGGGLVILILSLKILLLFRKAKSCCCSCIT